MGIDEEYAALSTRAASQSGARAGAITPNALEFGLQAHDPLSQCLGPRLSAPIVIRTFLLLVCAHALSASRVGAVAALYFHCVSS